MNSTERLLNAVADHIAATLEQSTDNRAWTQLLIYCPKELIIQRTQALASLQGEDAVERVALPVTRFEGRVAKYVAQLSATGQADIAHLLRRDSYALLAAIRSGGGE